MKDKVIFDIKIQMEAVDAISFNHPCMSSLIYENSCRASLAIL